MKMKTLKPLYLGGQTLTEGRSFETNEQHGRELIQKGYAELDDSKDESVVNLVDEGGPSTLALTSASLNQPMPLKKSADPTKKKGA